jgi:hypothetical protein
MSAQGRDAMARGLGRTYLFLRGMAPTDAEDARARVAELDWWRTMEVALGVVTPGGWDLRTMAGRLPWQSSQAGMRCLDVGTMGGFWAFELERRGAGEVVASHVLDATRLDRFLVDRLSGLSPPT